MYLTPVCITGFSGCTLANNNKIVSVSSRICTKVVEDELLCASPQLVKEFMVGQVSGADRDQCKSYCKRVTGFDAVKLYSRTHQCLICFPPFH